MLPFACQINNVPVSPCLNPPPERWWCKSFEYFQVFPLIQGETYGPFCRIGGEEFEPIIGVLGDPYSEAQCFYGLTEPKDSEEARRLYNLPSINPCSHVHKFYLNIPQSCDNGQIYIGPVRGALSFQVGINGKVAELIREEIRQGKIDTTLLE
jgi:hypothetical protein